MVESDEMNRWIRHKETSRTKTHTHTDAHTHTHKQIRVKSTLEIESIVLETVPFQTKRDTKGKWEAKLGNGWIFSRDELHHYEPHCLASEPLRLKGHFLFITRWDGFPHKAVRALQEHFSILVTIPSDCWNFYPQSPRCNSISPFAVPPIPSPIKLPV